MRKCNYFIKNNEQWKWQNEDELNSSCWNDCLFFCCSSWFEAHPVLSVLRSVSLTGGGWRTHLSSTFTKKITKILWTNSEKTLVFGTFLPILKDPDFLLKTALYISCLYGAQPLCKKAKKSSEQVSRKTANQPLARLPERLHGTRLLLLLVQNHELLWTSDYTATSRKKDRHKDWDEETGRKTDRQTDRQTDILEKNG